MRTKDEAVQALIVHVLVYEHLLLGLDAAAQEPDEVSVLELCDQLDLGLELHQPLHRARRQPLDRNLKPATQFALEHKYDNT